MAAKSEPRRMDRMDLLINSLLVGLLAVVLVVALVWQLPFAGQVNLAAGDVALRNVVAPRQITYESAVLTQKARDRAAQAVPDFYDMPQGRIRRQQINEARDVLEFISTVRGDIHALPEDQLDYLLSIEGIDLDPATARQILDLSAEDWQAVVKEVPLTLDQVMREEIKESTLPAVRRRVPVMISTDLDEEVSSVVTELVRSLIRPNSFFNAEHTMQLREQARSAVPVQTQTLEQGEIILRAGDIVTAEDVEALEQMGLRQSEWNWWSLLQAGLIGLTLIALMGGAIYRLRPQTLLNRPELALLAALSLTGILAAKLMIVPHDWLPYLFPLAAISMLITVLLDLRMAIVLTLVFALLIGYLSNGDMGLIAYSSAGALLGSLVLGRAERLTAFLWAALAIMLSNLAVTVAFWAPPVESTSPQLYQSLAVALLNGGLAASMALIGYFTLGNLFGLVTSLQLMELSRPTHPLLRQLLLKAPGTYHHTILVSNLAERAAEAIGADAFLTRVGAYYHDIGKTVRPYFFAENIADGSSPHANLDSLTSAQIIISHVKDGVDLARKYRLPAHIQDFIWEHHGAQLMTYFYQQALDEAEEDETVDEADFRYPGPDPRSKESAIMLLADTCEAAVRAERPATREELEDLVDELITQRVLDGALNNCNLTFKELQTVKKVFLQVLQGVHHPRIKYPKLESAEPNPAAVAVNGHERQTAPVPSLPQPADVTQ